jgi:hypothetical protein
MKRIEVYAAGILLALVPAVFGLWGNASFSQAVPIRVPAVAKAPAAGPTHETRAVLAAHHAGRESVEDHHGRHGADDPVGHDVGDDRGGDRGSNSGEAEPGDDHGGTSGRDTSGRDTSGRDTSGRDASVQGTSGKSKGGSGSHGSGRDGHGGSDDKESGGHGSDD